MKKYRDLIHSPRTMSLSLHFIITLLVSPHRPFLTPKPQAICTCRHQLGTFSLDQRSTSWIAPWPWYATAPPQWLSTSSCGLVRIVVAFPTTPFENSNHTDSGEKTPNIRSQQLQNNNVTQNKGLFSSRKDKDTI